MAAMLSTVALPARYADYKVQGVSKKVCSWEILAKITSTQSWRKLSVSPISLTLSRTFLFRFVSRKCVTKRQFKNGLCTKMSHYTRCLNYLGQNKEYVVQAFKVLKNLVHAEANARA